jgi:hypothetical protein
MDRDLFNFTELAVDGMPRPDGDIAFDEEPCATPASPASSTTGSSAIMEFHELASFSNLTNLIDQKSV